MHGMTKAYTGSLSNAADTSDSSRARSSIRRVIDAATPRSDESSITGIAPGTSAIGEHCDEESRSVVC